MSLEESRPNLFLAWARGAGFFRGFLLVSLIPVSTGAVIAARSGGRVDPLWFALGLVAVWLFHAGANLLNDYYDHLSGTDDINEVRTPFSGGTRVIQDGLLGSRAVRNAGWLSFVLGVPIFLELGLHRGPLVFAFAAAGAACGILYTLKPIWLSYRGVGEIMIGAVFGPLLTAYGAYVQIGRVPPSAWVTGLSLGLWAMAIITVNEIPDCDADREVGKRNLVVRLGPERGLMLWTLLLWSAVAILFLGVIAGVLPKKAVVATPIAFAVLALTHRRSTLLDDLTSLVSACRFTILALVGYWLLLLAGFYFSPPGA